METRPVPWGIEFAKDPRNPPWRDVLRDCAAAGYRGIELDPIGFTLSGGERQTVAIARTVHFGAKVLILDELTSALAVRQTSNVLATVDRVRKQGIGVVFITHNVRHAMAVGDRFTVLNRGQTLGTAVKGEITPEELQDLMAGGQELAQLEGSLGGTV